MYNFNYHRAKDLADAKEKFDQAEDGLFLAGGMTIIPTLKQRLANPSDVIDLADLSMTGISEDGNAIVIGAMTKHAEVAASDLVTRKIPGLAALADGIGDPQVRNRGTIGGSIANNDPAADYPAACLALGATIVTTGREIAADDFFKGLFETALEEAELITTVRFPVPKRSNYQKFPNPASRYAIVGVMAAETADGPRVAVTGAAQGGVFRVAEMEAALASNWSAASVEGIAVPEDGLNSDIHASAEYRAHLVTVMAKRAVDAAG
ncbi:MAG: xanthine dehydrogenase family protein subunit M [Alphaproteobacteria bacterium]|nr:xanthine dehydrogenase family protein subunit M [Alphaproteobacteria bacterium]